MSCAYIAGPMRGIPEFNFPAFDEAAKRWRAAGWHVISPAEMDRKIDGFDERGKDGTQINVELSHYVKRDIAVLVGFSPSDGDAIAMLPGWEKSRGARAEKAVAEWLGLKVLDAVTFLPIESADRLKQLEDERSRVYGDPEVSHRAIGYVWRGILQNRFHELEVPPISADLVAELLAAFKVCRLSRPVYHQDSVDDAKVYLGFSERFRTKPART